MRKVDLHVNKVGMDRLKYMTHAEGLSFSLASPIRKNRTVYLYTTDVSRQSLLERGESEINTRYVVDSASGGNIPLTDCREMLTNHVRTAYAGVYSNKCRLDKFRLVVFDTYDKIWQNGYYKKGEKRKKAADFVYVVKALNVIEKAKGWKPTYPYKISLYDNHQTGCAVTNSYLLIAPKQWIDSPYMTSLYLLLVRILVLLSRHSLLKSGFDDIDDIDYKLRCVEKEQGRHTRLTEDIHMLSGTFKKDWRILVNHSEEIHKGSKRQHWISGIGETCGYYVRLSELYTDGLDRLLIGHPFNRIIGDRFEKIAKKTQICRQTEIETNTA